MPQFVCGSFLGCDVASGLAKGVICKGAQVFLPAAYHHFSPTAPKFLPIVTQLCGNQVLEECKAKDVKCTHPLFAVYKDARTCRPVYDMSALGRSGLFKLPPFTLPCIRKVLQSAPKGSYAIKIDLCNGFYHIPVAPGGRGYFGLKCAGKYYRFRKLPMGWAGSPYVMQACMTDIFKRIGERFGILTYTYLDDVLLVGRYWQLRHALSYLLTTDLMINNSKNQLVPCRRLRYLGFNICLRTRRFRITAPLHEKLSRALSFVAGPDLLSGKFWERLGGLINFVVTFFGLPAFWTQLALARNARISLLEKALPTGWTYFEKVTRGTGGLCRCLPCQLGYHLDPDCPLPGGEPHLPPRNKGRTFGPNSASENTLHGQYGGVIQPPSRKDRTTHFEGAG